MNDYWRDHVREGRLGTIEAPGFVPVRLTEEPPAESVAFAPLPEHMPREHVVIPGPTACPCYGGRLSRLDETITKSLESVPRQWKVVQTVREKFSRRSSESIAQPPAPLYPIARGRAVPNLLALILTSKFCVHQPLNRQSDA
jgi:transposase